MPPVGFEPTISAGERPAAAHLAARPAFCTLLYFFTFESSVAFTVLDEGVLVRLIT